MTEKELKKLSRMDLLEMLINQSKELNRVKEKLEKAEKTLQEREIAINEAGSIAEASLQLNGIFQAAQDSCNQYLENVRILSERQERVCQTRERECEEKTQKQLEETRKYCEKLESDTKINCAEMVAKAKAESEAYWNDVYHKLEDYCRQRQELIGILANTFTDKRIGH